ncbi:hypothetical protein KIS4809_2672 [Bacillus sp. ZZV12-4809]|nr:hypothetical protein KIS4809_2672 [Bacillus sp. ZZV12-4809]
MFTNLLLPWHPRELPSSITVIKRASRVTSIEKALVLINRSDMAYMTPLKEAATPAVTLAISL